MLSTYESIGQSFLKDQKHLKMIAKRRARKELLKSVNHEGRISKFEAHALNATLKSIPVLSFTISPEAIEYDSTKKITDYLLPNSYFPIEFAMLMKKGKFYAALDCSKNVNYSSCEVCKYDDSMVEKKDHNNYEIRQLFKELSTIKYTLLFTVQYFRKAVWFVENNKIYTYCMDDNRIYDPDEFIKKRCSIQVIKDIADGKLNSICN
jgi:hypothetical protein